MEKSGKLLTLTEARDLLDVLYLINAIIKNKGNISRVAEELDLGRRTIYDLMEKYGISFSDDRLSLQLTPLIQYLELRAPYIERYLEQID